MFRRAETRSISIAALPGVVHAYVADGERLPEWAPDFAPRIQRDGDDWRIAYDGGEELAIGIASDAAHGTVEILDATSRRARAFLRAIPNGDGSELLFTILMPSDAPEDAVARQLATIDAELATVRDVCSGD